MNPKANLALQIFLWLITIVVTAAVILLLVKYDVLAVNASSEEPIIASDFLPLGRGGSLSFVDIRFCQLVDENYVCYNEEENFISGDKVYVVFLAKTSNYEGTVTLSRNYRLINPLGKTIVEMDDKNEYSFSMDTNKDEETIVFSDYFLTTENYIPGEYILELLVKNPLLNKEIIAKKAFKLI